MIISPSLFNPLEAVARVNSNIRRFYALGTQNVARGEITVRDLTLDPESCTLKKAGQVIELTSVEYRIMELFMQHPGKVFTKQQIYEQGWGRLILLPTTILWSVSASFARSWMRIRLHIFARSVVLDTGWRSR